MNSKKCKKLRSLLKLGDKKKGTKMVPKLDMRGDSADADDDAGSQPREMVPKLDMRGVTYYQRTHTSPSWQLYKILKKHMKGERVEDIYALLKLMGYKRSS